ncbi:hypothetical protein HDU76_005617 [Blyttiomyces sp. JEL0837]|nr:hypothetical protein HDU76_005617 [Blyttiomyces sp. JEL0837]
MILRESKIDTLADLCRSLQIHLDSVDALLLSESFSRIPSQESLDEESMAMAMVDGDIQLAMEIESGVSGSAGGMRSSRAVALMQQQQQAMSKEAPVKHVVERILQDAQERLAFRAQQYIKQEIESFRPRDRELEVLARTEKLPQPNALASQANMVPDLAAAGPSVSSIVAASSSPNSTSPTTSGAEATTDANGTGTASSSSVNGGDDSERVVSVGKLVYGGGEWYPTLQRTLYILGKMYRSLPAAIFEDLAQEAVELCRRSMVLASDVIGKKNTRLDGQFFLIKNLLMLREQIAPFDSNFVRKEEYLDFSNISDALVTFFKNQWGISTLTNLGIGLVTSGLPIPRVMETALDSKLSVNLELKRVCEEMILDTAKLAVEPVASFMIKVTAFKLKSERVSGATPTAVGGVAGGGVGRLGAQAFASPQQCVAVSKAFLESVKGKLSPAVGKMADYLGDKRTEAVLLLHLKSNIVETYKPFYLVATSEHAEVLLEGLATPDEVSHHVDVVCEKALVRKV